jgi:hypothetical protein
MIKIPATNKYYVSNESDLIPNIQHTKNIDFDEAGYAKISAPFVKLTSEADVADFSIVTDIINIGSAQAYKVATTENIYDVNLASVTVALDASAPTDASDEGRFVGWKGGDWYFNTASDIYSLQATAGTTWDIENTDGIDFATVFVNRNTLCGVLGSNIQQYLTTDMDGASPPSTNSSTTLVLPSNFTVMGMAYSNYRMGIATRSNINGEAYFFTWDGATTDAGQGLPVNAPMILDIVAYKNSWAVLTSTGQLLHFNGGGFDELGNLPPYYFGDSWCLYSGSQEHGRTMTADGDVIYINLGSLLESSPDDSGIRKGFYSGVWCYDPEVGLYHRHALSNSLFYRVSLSPTANVYTSVAHSLLTGDKVRYSTGVIYYAIYVTADTFKLADTYDLAVADTPTSDTVNGTMSWIKREDWSQLTASNTNTGACIKFDNGSSVADEGVSPFFAGLGLVTKAAAYNNTFCLMAPVFDNISSITYYKIKSENITDNWVSVIVKNRKLFENDKIIVKAKYRETYDSVAIGEAGDSSPDRYITWTDSTTFTTTEDISLVEVGDEVEFYAGAGAGSTAHVVSATDNSGTWTVVVDEAIRGGASGNKSTCLFEPFKKIGTITKDNQSDENYNLIRLGVTSKSIQIKLELRGLGVAIEELIINNVTHKPVI